MLSNGLPELDDVIFDRTPRDLLLKQAKPVLKWAGGKRQLAGSILAAIDRLVPGQIETYHEPFAGGLAIFFALAAKKKFRYARLSDTNRELIEMYIAIRDNVQGVMRELAKLTRLPQTKETFLAIRNRAPRRSASSRAARMIYLNKTCFNGLYRVNKQGRFNVPYGKQKNPLILDRETLLAASEALHGVSLQVRSFGQTWYEAKPGDLVYYDPPYVPLSKTSSFHSYQAGGFNAEAHARLARQFGSLGQVPALLSNSYCRETLKLYKGFVRHRLAARRAINSNGAKRGAVSELLVENRYRK